MSNLTINQAERIVRDFVERHSWDKEALLTDLAHMVEEFGEMAREILSIESRPQKKKFRKQIIDNLAEELSDLFYFTLKISNRFNIDLGKSFLKKMKKNEARWPVKK